MFASKLILIAFFGALASAESWSNAQSTKTLEPAALGTSTSNGALLVSMNYCTVVMNTQCQVSVMTSAAPPPTQGNPPVTTTNSAVQSVPVPTPFTMSSSTVASSTVAPSSTEESTSETTEPATVTSHSGTPAVTSSALTAAAAGIKAFPGAAWGAAFLAVAMML
ncbi:hypothetical protein AAL_06129 [Moelleriella libera RCEF 2490]|uniref:Uncharacterized protein n=1 Tax=Moelleriella libera RCEF 2490 TaxID=1081109 RepID=A0A162IF24_9HYPO|nr:hypothetical protein AAL_06129 [Moelleriella libera RCEF 2490]